MIKNAYHLLALIGALLSCITSSVIFSRLGSPHLVALKLDRSRALSLPIHEGTSGPVPPNRTWTAPACSRDESWRFELFTPPAMTWDAATSTYKVSPHPKTEPSVEAASSPSGVMADPDGASGIAPRFQLLGYVQREAGELAGIFQNVETGEVRVVLSGSPVDDWRATVERVELETTRIKADTLDVQLPRARALIRDQLLDCTYALSTQEVPRPLVHFAKETKRLVRDDLSRDG